MNKNRLGVGRPKPNNTEVQEDQRMAHSTDRFLILAGSGVLIRFMPEVAPQNRANFMLRIAANPRDGLRLIACSPRFSR